MKIPVAQAIRASGWTVDLPAEGSSMEPLIFAGDSVTVAMGRVERMTIGDLVCFQRGDAVVVHRILEVTGDGRLLLEKGDAERAGSWIREDQVLGRVVKIRGERLAERPAGSARHRFSRFEHRLSAMLRRTGWQVPAVMVRVWSWGKRRLRRSAVGR